MSLSFRLTEIEKSIAYSDVKKAFTNRRDAWLKATIDHQGSPHKLADLLLELLDAFTNSCINFLFPKPGGFKEMRESIVRIGTATPKETTAAKALREVRQHPNPVSGARMRLPCTRWLPGAPINSPHPHRGAPAVARGLAGRVESCGGSSTRFRPPNAPPRFF